MHNSKLITLLKTFSKEEMKEFEKFISSPYFSRGRNLIPLFKIFKSYYPDFNNIQFTKENIYRRLYPHKKYEKIKSNHILQVLITEMMQLAEKFLVYNGFETGNFQYHFNRCLSLAYEGKYLKKSVIKVLLKNSDLIDKDEKDYLYYLRRYHINNSLSSYFTKEIEHNKIYRSSEKNILYIYAFLMEVFAQYHNKYRANKRNFNIIFKGYDQIMLFVKAFDVDLFVKECEEDDYETKNLVLIKYYILKSRIDEYENESLSHAFKIYFRIFKKLSHQNKYGIFTQLLNRCIGRVRYDEIYIKKGNELIDFVWNNGITGENENDYILLMQYISALPFKSSSANYNELHKFVLKYSTKVDPVYFTGVKNYSQIFLYFKEKAFDKCLKQLSITDLPTIPSVKISKYKLKICCFYELSYIEDILSAIDSFDHYLRKNKNVSEINNTECFKFINGIKKLIKIKLYESNEPELEKINVLELTQNSFLGYWFKEKLKELECTKASL
jgi:hypothetical protein